MTTDNLKEDKARKHGQQPVFTRADAHKKKRVGTGWRKPKGWQNKMRLHKKGYRVTVKPGYGTPVELQGCAKSGLAIITINNLDELKAINVKTQAALLANVGRRKKEELITYATENKIELVNLSVKTFQEKSKALKAEKVAKAQSKAEKEKAEAEKIAQAKDAEKKAADDKKKAEEAKTAEEVAKDLDAKKDAEKKEKEKVLTSKKGF